MFGADYFESRAKLANLAARIIELADKTGADKSALENDDIAEGLASPYLFIACGETNSGKSTLLNAIFGSEICLSDHGAANPRLRWFRYGEKTRNKEITPQVEECYRQVEFLKHFNLMDTPGTNSSVKEQQQITQRFFPSSDLIFWVIPESNPWGASLWDFISSQPESILKKSVLILHRKDSGDGSDLEIVLGHVRDLARQRLAHVPPIFPVSSELAWQAKLANPVDSELWHESGYPEFEQHIADAVDHSPARQRMLIDIRRAMAEVLRNVEHAVEQRASQLNDNEQFLRGLEAEVDEERESHSSDFEIKFAEMRELFAGKNKEAKRYVRRKLGFWSTLKSLFTAENTSKTIEACLADSIESSVKAQASIDGGCLVDDCRKHWETVRPRVDKKLSIQLDDFDCVGEGFGAIRESFNERMANSAHQAVMNLRIRKGINPQVVARREHLKSWLYITLIFFLLAGVTGALQVVLGLGVVALYVSLGMLALALLSSLFFAIRVRVTGKKITKSLGRRLERARMSFAWALERDYKDGVRGFYIEYGSLLSHVRRHIFEAQQEFRPNLKQRNRLFLELMIIEREM